MLCISVLVLVHTYSGCPLASRIIRDQMDKSGELFQCATCCKQLSLLVKEADG